MLNQMILKSKEVVLSFALISLLSLSFSGASERPSIMEEKEGIMVLAHGGDPQWNAAVREAVDHLRSHCPVVVAFGMADRNSLQSAIDRLEQQGVNRIAVVRLFVSNASFSHQFEYLLGVRPDPPGKFIEHTMDQTNQTQIPKPVRKKSLIVFNQKGLFDSSTIGQIITERIGNLSLSPKLESVLILAHGAGGDSENNRWLLKIRKLVNEGLKGKQFRSIRIMTLREDWKEKRRAEQREIRDFVKQGNRNGSRVIVVPFRLFGFGPYRDVLKDLEYVADGLGLLPHANVTDWIKSQAMDCFSRAGWTSGMACLQK